MDQRNKPNKMDKLKALLRRRGVRIKGCKYYTESDVRAIVRELTDHKDKSSSLDS